LVEVDDAAGRTWRVLLDLGNGALGALHKYADPLSIDAVLLSHLHADHCLDLASYYVLRKYHPTGPQRPIPVWGPTRTADRMARAYDLPLDPGMRHEFEFHEWAGSIEFGPFAIDAIPVAHPVPAFGLRVTAGGATLAYSGDTGPCPALDDVARSADLFLAEASFRSLDDNPPDLHLTGTDGALVATRAGAKRLVLTHIPPWYDAQIALAEAVAAFAGPVELARAGATYDL
jgi:ribonuclease BN (tRNA processing enzyme)